MRAFIIMGALVSLCISNNVGTRLLPLPALAEVSVVAGQMSPDANAKSLPSPGNNASFRVAIAPPTQNRAGTERQPLPVAAHMPKGISVAPGEVRSFSGFVYKPLPLSTALAAQPPGRAPPNFV